VFLLCFFSIIPSEAVNSWRFRFPLIYTK